MAATRTTSGTSLTIAPAASVFDVPLFGGLYAPAADGRRFLIANAGALYGCGGDGAADQSARP